VIPDKVLDIALIVIAFFGAFLAALWLSLIIWTFRDIRSRTRDIFAQILATLVVAILTLPGLLIYFMLRPRETLAEAYERSLEEEALLQGIEEAEECPGCGGRVHSDFIVCPTCHTKLKRACIHCGKPLNLRWTVCPYCAGTVLAQGAPPPTTPTMPSASEPRKAQRVESAVPGD
jgi:Double zinc ribbon